MASMPHPGAITVPQIERRYAARLRVRVPASGFGEMLNEMHGWLDARAGRGRYRLWGDLHALRFPDTIALFVDDPRVAVDLIERFGLEPAPFPSGDLP